MLDTSLIASVRGTVVAVGMHRSLCVPVTVSELKLGAATNVGAQDGPCERTFGGLNST